MKWSYAKVFVLGLTVFHLLGSAGVGKGGLEVHAAEANPGSPTLSVEARYSSNKIIFPVTEGASGYDVYRAESEEGEFVKLTASPLTAAANQAEITYDDGVTYAMDASGDATRGECAAMLKRFEEKYIPYE